MMLFLWWLSFQFPLFPTSMEHCRHNNAFLKVTPPMLFCSDCLTSVCQPLQLGFVLLLGEKRGKKIFSSHIWKVDEWFGCRWRKLSHLLVEDFSLSHLSKYILLAAEAFSWEQSHSPYYFSGSSSQQQQFAPRSTLAVEEVSLFPT